MANSAGMLKESIWRDKDFRALPRTAQATYAQILSQKDLDRAGMQPLHITKLAKGCDEITEDDIRADLAILEDRRYVFIDEDTDELFTRSYMRHSEVTKYPQYLKSALRCARMVASLKLRHELAIELRRLRNADANKVADEIDPGPTVPEPSENPSETVPEPCPHPSGTVNGAGTVPAPSRVRERVGVVTYVGGSVGEARARDSDTDTTPPAQPSIEPPPRFCPKHMPDGTDAKCGACRGHRQRRERWDAEHEAFEAEQRMAEARRRRDCPDCDESGWLLDEPGGAIVEPAIRCDHRRAVP